MVKKVINIVYGVEYVSFLPKKKNLETNLNMNKRLIINSKENKKAVNFPVRPQ